MPQPPAARSTAAAVDVDLDQLAPLIGTHTTKDAVGQRIVLVLIFLPQVWNAYLAFQEHRWRWATALTACLVLAVVLVVWDVRRPSGTRITTEGLHLRHDVVRRRFLPWSQVRRITPAWYPRGATTVTTVTGRTLTLPGVPQALGQQLARACGSSR